MSEFERLVHRAEKGEDNGDISRELKGMGTQEQLSAAREMRRINEQDRQADSSLPKLELTIARDGQNGPDVLVGVDLKHTAGINPASWGNAFKDNDNLYKVPFLEQTPAMRADTTAQYFKGEKRE